MDGGLPPHAPSARELRLRVREGSIRIFIYNTTPAVDRVHDVVPLGPHRRYLQRMERFLKRFRTSDADAADFYFIPASLISYQFGAAHADAFEGKAPDPWEYIGSLPFIDRGNHLLVAGGDFGQRRRSSYESMAPGRAYPELYEWLDERFILLAFESTSDLLPQDIGILPYPLPPASALARMRQRLTIPWRTRDLLFSFAGAITYPQLPPSHIRGGAMKPIAGRHGDSFVGTPDAARHAYGSRGEDVSLIQRSVFTLCPAGFGRWSFRFLQALRFGSIPVLLADGYVKPFAEFIPWDELVITVPERDLAAVPDMLRSIPAARIAAYQERIHSCRHLFTEEGVHHMTLLQLAQRQSLNPERSAGAATAATR